MSKVRSPSRLEGEVLLGTVAIEPNRWGTIRPDRSPQIRLAEWTDRIAALGVHGIEVWEGHVTGLDDIELAALLDGPAPVRIFNSYADFDEPDPADRDRVASWVERTGAVAVKFNVGNDPGQEGAYADRLAAWLDALPPGVAAICECHHSISIAEDPAVAARILEAAGPPDRVQALVHTHDGTDGVAAKLDALGDRVTHVHVNYLDTATFQHPPLAQVEDELASVIDTLSGRGFRGSWTLEFVAGLLTDDDRPEVLLDQAAADLEVLRRLLPNRAP